jgi:hypothetical protein
MNMGGCWLRVISFCLPFKRKSRKARRQSCIIVWLTFMPTLWENLTTSAVVVSETD